jgi:polyhydroxyalkanoate synthesis regulator phasin
MSAEVRKVVRYRNRKLYEPAERRFVTIHDLARSVASGKGVQVRAADTGEDITARILSRALASEKAASPPSTDALTRLLQAGSEAADTVAGVVERVGGTRLAATVRRAAAPERLAETLAPLTRNLGNARVDVERIVAGLVGRGRLTWEEGARLKQEVGSVFQRSLGDVLAGFRDLMARMTHSATPELAQEFAELRARLEQLEGAASKAFETRPAHGANGKQPRKTVPRTAPRTKRRKKP